MWKVISNLLEPVFIKKDKDRVKLIAITCLHEVYTGAIIVAFFLNDLDWIYKVGIILLMLYNVEIYSFILIKNGSEIKIKRYTHSLYFFKFWITSASKAPDHKQRVRALNTSAAAQ